MKKVVVFLADGFEEVEGLTVVDLLRRAGAVVETVSVMGKLQIDGAHGIPVEADELFEKAFFDDAELLVLPGGMPGTLHLKEHKGLADLLCKFNEKGKRIAAICAAPTVFGALGLLKESKVLFLCHRWKYYNKPWCGNSDTICTGTDPSAFWQ